MEFIKKTVKVGNSSGVILPKKLLGSTVKVTVLKKPLNIKKESLKILTPYFKEIRGVYIINKNPAEVLAVSRGLTKIIKDRIKVSIIPLKKVKIDIKSKDRLRNKLIDAEVILDKSLLVELKKEIKQIEEQL